MDIDLKKLSVLLSGRTIGHKIIFLDEVDSTNDYAWKIARAGGPEGVMVVADTQSAGKGRLGRSWQSPPGGNLYTSVILRPAVELSAVARITLAAGIAVAEVLLDFCPGKVRLKWPNDVQMSGRKVCGILTEMKSGGDRPEYVIVGIGVNLNMKRNEFLEDLRDLATSLQEETGTRIDRTGFIVRLSESLEKWYRIFLSGDFNTIKERWLKLSGMVGREVRVGLPDHEEHGKVLGLSDSGALLLLDQQGKVREILAGDVSLREKD